VLHPTKINALKPVCSLFALSLMVSLSGCAGSGTGAPPQMPPSAVEITEVQPVSVEETADYMGNLISRYSVMIDSKNPGIVQKVHVKPGDHVQKGQPLLEIVADEERSGLNSTVAQSQVTRTSIVQTQKDYEALVAQRKGLESTLSLNETELGRYTRLKELKSASQEQVDQYKDAVKRANSALAANTSQLQGQQEVIRAARRNYQGALAQVKVQQVKVNDRFIRAPFSGTVGEVQVKVGSYVQPLNPLLTLTQNQTLELNVELPAEELHRAKPGIPLRIIQDGSPAISAPLSFIAPNVSPETQTVLVKAIFPNHNNQLRADQSVHTQVVWERRPGVKLPMSAVLHLGGKDFVYFAQPDPKNPKGIVAKQRPVELGSIQGNDYIVQQGVHPGDKIITAGIQKLRDGAPVMPLNSPAGNPPSQNVQTESRVSHVH
jgi:multidrug efflux pump subunit AcrA (membrane-fusion protein)